MLITMENSTAKVIAVYGSVVDAQFGVTSSLPPVGTMLKVVIPPEKEVSLQIVEHRANNVCRCIALGFTYGVSRNMSVLQQEKELSVPRDLSQLYGRVLNALAQPIDHKGELDLSDSVPLKSLSSVARREINLDAEIKPEIIYTGIKMIDLLFPLLAKLV